MTQSNPLPPLLITMGDPGGIGPEIVIKLWHDRTALSLPPFAFVGCPDALTAYAPDLPLTLISDPSETTAAFGHSLPVLDINEAITVTAGVSDATNGPAIIKAIDVAVGFCLSGSALGLVTMPIQKSSLYKAGFTAPGHTEYLARLCGVDDDGAVMMLANDQLRVVPVTVHQALKDVPKSLTDLMIIDKALTTARDLRARFGLENPRIAVAGLNPHAGEDGMMGLEDGVIITPAITTLKDMGLDVSGPHPADTLFHAEARATYDAALCMYHDQALIPVKTLDFHGSVNVTLGLPIIRTSPDHGTALAIAGSNKAVITSSLNALRMAYSMAMNGARENGND